MSSKSRTGSELHNLRFWNHQKKKERDKTSWQHYRQVIKVLQYKGFKQFKSFEGVDK